MGLLSRLLDQGDDDIRTSPELEGFLQVYGSNDTYAGISITPEQALRVSTVHACVKILAETIALLPLLLYRRLPDGGRERATDHPLFDILHNRPNPWQTSFEWREQMQAHLALRGNAYAFVNRVRGRVIEILPLNPSRIRVTQDKVFSIKYHIPDRDGQDKEIRPQDMLHLRGLSMDGLVGLSPIAQAREAIGLATATERFGAQLFRNGAKMSGILSHPTHFKDDESSERIRKSWDESTSSENAHKTAVLEDGVTWERVSMAPDDAQFILTREHQIPEIARYYRIPLHKLQFLKAATYRNIEHQSIDFVNDAIVPWVTRWEQRLSTQLLSKEERADFFIAFLVDGLLKGDIKSRNEALEIERRNGIISANEWRKLVDMSPRTDPGGEVYITPLNMGPETKPGAGSDPEPDSDLDPPDPDA